MLDAMDKRILRTLAENSRLSFREIARRIKASPATVLSRVRRMEEEGVIRSYGVILDYEKAGYDLGAVILVKISKGKLFEVEKKIAIHPNVETVHDITGDYDCVIVARFPSRRSLDAFLKHIQTFDFVERTHTTLILNTIAGKTVIPA